MLTIRLILSAVALIALEAAAEINVWQGHALPNHVPGSDARPVWYVPGGEAPILTTIWFNDSSDVATFTLRNPEQPLDVMPRIYCATAGQEGPLIWQAPLVDQVRKGYPGIFYLDWAITAEELFISENDPRCGITINNIASLKAAAEQRLLYVETERDGERYRTQLWPDIEKSVGGYLYYEDRVVASTRQVVGRPSEVAKEKTTVRIRVSDYGVAAGLFGYYLPQSKISHDKIADVGLHCAPAGEIGPRVATLEFGWVYTGAGRYNWLHNGKLTPTSAESSCGMEINNIASLTEALFRGNLYVLLTREDGMLWRGQLARAQEK